MSSTDAMAEAEIQHTEVPARPEIHLSTENKIVDDLDILKEKLEKLKAKGKKIGYVTGTFDVSHLGHLGLLDFAKQHCDILVVGTANDDLTIATKGEELFTQDQRAMHLSMMQMVDHVFKMDNPNTHGDSPEARKYLDEVAVTINPDVIIASSKTDSNFETKQKQAKSLGCKFIDYDVPAFASSTNIRKWVEESY